MPVDLASEITGTEVQSAPASQVAPAPASTPSSATTQETSSAAGSVGTQTAQQEQQAQNVRDVLASYGYDVRNQFQNDHAALQHMAFLARQAQEQQQILPYAQEYMRNAAEFQQWQQQRQQELARQQQPKQEPWFKAPDYDPSWQQKIYRDANGNLQVLPGNDPALINKYTAWVEHQQRFLNNFSKDPVGAIKPGIEEMVQQVAGQMIQQQLARMQEQQFAQTFIERNSEWLHERDAQGNLLQDPRTGRPALSSLGRQFAQYVQQAERMGLYDSHTQQQYAMTALQRDFLASRYQQQAGLSQGEAAKQQFLAQAAGQQAAAPAATQANTNGSYQAPNGNSLRGLQELMAREFAAAGIGPGTNLVG